MLLLYAVLEVLAATEPPDQEDTLNAESVQRSNQKRKVKAYCNASSGAFDLHRLDLVNNQAEDVGDKGGKYGFQVFPIGGLIRHVIPWTEDSIFTPSFSSNWPQARHRGRHPGRPWES